VDTEDIERVRPIGHVNSGPNQRSTLQSSSDKILLPKKISIAKIADRSKTQNSSNFKKSFFPI